MRPTRLFTGIVFLCFFITALLPILFIVFTPVFEGASENIFDERHLSLGKSSLGIALGTVGAGLCISLPLSFLLARTDLYLRNVWAVAFCIPALIPPYIHAIAWKQLDMDFAWPMPFGINTIPGVVMVMAFAYFPFLLIMVFSGLKSIDRNMEEASLLVFGRLKTARQITFPLIFPYIFSGSAFVFIFSIIDFGVPDILRVNVYPVEIFIQFSAFYDATAAFFLSVPLISITALLVSIQKKIMGGRPYIQIFSGFSSDQAVISLGGWQTPALAFCSIVLTLSVIVPLFSMAVAAGNPANYLTAIGTSLREIGFSFLMATIGTVVIVFFGFFLSYLIERSCGFISLCIEYGSYVLLAIPAVTMGITMIKIWNRPLVDVVYSSPVILIFGYIARFIPFSVIATTSSLKQINPSAVEIAYLHRPGWFTNLRKVVMPMASPGMLTSAFVVFILSFGDLGTTLLLIPPGRETVGIKIYNLMHYGAHELVNALCLSVAMMMLGFFLLFMAVYRFMLPSVRK